MKSRMTEQKNARARIPFKSVEEVDREIQRLEKQVDTGKMKLVDEKKALADISSLRKQRKGFAGFDETQKGIDDMKSQLADLRKDLNDPEATALSEKYSGIAKELDEIKARQDEAYKSINALRDERTNIQAEQQTKYAAIRAVRDAYYNQRKAYNDYENEAYRARKERQKSERDAYEKDKRRKIAEKKLEEAAEPAYMDEILTAEGLIRYFDPAAGAGLSSKTSSGPGKFAAQAQRVVDGKDIKGTKVERKDEEDYFKGTGGKKGKKGKKGGSAAATTNGASSPAPASGESAAAAGPAGKFNLSMGVIEELGKVNVEPPMGQADVAAVVEKLQGKLKNWRESQEKKTEEVCLFLFSGDGLEISLSHYTTLSSGLVLPFSIPSSLGRYSTDPHHRTSPKRKKKSTVSKPRPTIPPPHPPIIPATRTTLHLRTAAQQKIHPLPLHPQNPSPLIPLPPPPQPQNPLLPTPQPWRKKTPLRVGRRSLPL